MTQQPAPATPDTLGVADDIVACALHDLGQFGELTYRQADALLAMWLRREELTDADRLAVLAYYRTAVK